MINDCQGIKIQKLNATDSPAGYYPISIPTSFFLSFSMRKMKRKKKKKNVGDKRK